MIDLPLIFVAGILGTAHCLGMCGPFALAVSVNVTDWRKVLARQLAYTAGRVFTYGALGVAAGFAGARLIHAWPAMVKVPATLAILAGGLLVYQGLLATGAFRKRGVPGGSSLCLTGGMFGQFLHQPGTTGAFLAGMFTALLPCGLLYGMLALAASSHSLLWGGATLVVFGLGTAPTMMLTGVSGRLMSVVTRRRLYTAAAWCLILMGSVSIARGVSLFVFSNQPLTGCPLCRN